MILRAVRDSNYVEIDIRARMAGNERAKQRLKEIIDDVGLEFFMAGSQKLVEDAEAFARDRIKTLRPGIYRARVFDDCPVYENNKLHERLAVIEIEVEITEDGDFLVRTPVVSPENRGFNNAYLPCVEATVFYTLLQLLLYDCRWNSGFARAIKIDYIPDKSRLSCSPERSTNFASVGIGYVFCNVLMDAISRACHVSGRYNDVVGGACAVNSGGVGGINQYGRIVVQTITSNPLTTGLGAVLDHDGIDSSVTMCNPWTYISDAEAEELGIPILELSRNHRPNSGGFGKFRGGTSAVHIIMIHNSPNIGLTKYSSGNKIASNQGLYGGYPGPASYLDAVTDTNFYDLVAKGAPLPYDPEKITEVLEVKGMKYSDHVSLVETRMKSGDMWASTAHGGGAGLGDPIEREPALIVRDLEDQVATLEVAEKIYAVSIDPKTLEIDREETEKLRKERRKERLAQSLPGIKYLAQMVQAREDKTLSRVALDFLAETESFCPDGFGKELAREKEFVSRGPQSVGEAKLGEKVLSLTPYVDMVKDEKGRNLAVCSQCGHVYCDASENFKYYCLIYDRDPSYFHLGRLAYDKDWCIYREFYCPSCASQVEVEAVPPGMPILWNYELKL